MTKDRKKNRNRRLYWYGVLLGLLIGTVILIGGIAAKYTYQKDDENVVAANVFYFSSNLLTEEGAEYILNSDATSVSFTLGNNEDDVRYSDDIVYYSVTVETDDSSEPLCTVSSAAGSINNDKVNTVPITLSNLKKGKTYTVIANGRTTQEITNEGYTKTIRATFKVSDNEENVYKYLDTTNHEYVLLTVWTDNLSGEADIDIKIEGLIPDNTDSVLKNINNFVDGKYKQADFVDNESFINTYSSRTYRFFIDTATDVDVEKFEVNIIDGSSTHLADPATP